MDESDGMPILYVGPGENVNCAVEREANPVTAHPSVCCNREVFIMMYV